MLHWKEYRPVCFTSFARLFTKLPRSEDSEVTFTKLPRSEDSEVTFKVIESSYKTWEPIEPRKDTGGE